jgi:hypothetical protein
MNRRKVDPLTQIVRTHRHQTKSTLLQTVKNFKKSFQSETKQVEKNIIAQDIKENWKEKRMNGQFCSNLDKNLVVKKQFCRWLKF